jgi:hypothetical protein
VVLVTAVAVVVGVALGLGLGLGYGDGRVSLGWGLWCFGGGSGWSIVVGVAGVDVLMLVNFEC